MKPISKYKTLALANESFTQEQYDQALRQYALVLKHFPDSKEAYNRAILAEMAMSGEMVAEALFDYYEILREESSESADTVISEILQSLDGTLDQLIPLLQEPMKNRMLYEDGIMYDEFLTLVKKSGDFRRVFENIMFSTKVLITQKDDFIDFLDLLSKNGFTQMAFNYIESALSMYPGDEKLRHILQTLSEQSS